jgi:ubiquinone/menaquinone biosynthesis C-methylase UbiE
MILIGVRVLRKFVHFPAPPFISYFLDSNLRRKMQPPLLVIKRSGIKEGIKVLEIGCGSGAFTPYIARAVGKKGFMYSLDIQQKMLDRLYKKLQKEENKDINNVKLILGNAYGLPFEDQSIDVVTFITVLQEIPDKAKALIEASRVLKKDGKLAITELLVDPDYPLRKTTIKQVVKAGFAVALDEGNLINYTICFNKTDK